MPERVLEGRPLVGDVVAGKYRIESVAGEGGMGIVYEAEHVILRQRVALKVIVPGAATSTEALDRFSLEASVIASMRSEHVVRVMDAGSLPNGAPYLVMEYLDGCDLDDLLAQRGPLPPDEVVDYALQALEALAHAHAARVIHRDLKPANLFLARSPDGREIIKLVDFGISTSFEFGSAIDDVVGSPAYMSPEQLRNAPIDLRTDLWSLGVVLYELLSGEPPFSGSLSELVIAVLEKEAIPLTEKMPTIPLGLSDVVARCLERELSCRWATTAELAHALAPYGTGAWDGALDRIDRALSVGASVPKRATRRYESFENALQALETEWQHDKGAETMAPPPSVWRPPSDEPPESDPFSQTIPAPSTATPGRSTLRILLIDDSHIALGLHEHALSGAGFDVKTTTSAREFDMLLETWKPHLVLMDVHMPGVSGDVLCRRVKARFRATVPVVFVSDMTPSALAQRAKVGGADAFFSKTADMTALVDFVRNICALTYSPEDLP